MRGAARINCPRVIIDIIRTLSGTFIIPTAKPSPEIGR
jgi:hypothetical protein